MIVLRVETLRADPKLAYARRSLEALANVAEDAARIVGRLHGCSTQRRAHEQPHAQTASARRILIIDDQVDNLDVLREVLELEGQDVEVAPSGASALELFERGERFDLVLCDVGMPEMNGWQVAGEIGKVAPGTPVWMLTGWAHEIGSSDPRRDLVEGVLGKPLDLEELRELLSAPAPARVTH
jgi:CheY-like chemotaxis protein